MCSCPDVLYRRLGSSLFFVLLVNVSFLFTSSELLGCPGKVPSLHSVKGAGIGFIFEYIWAYIHYKWRRLDWFAQLEPATESGLLLYPLHSRVLPWDGLVEVSLWSATVGLWWDRNFWNRLGPACYLLFKSVIAA